MYLLGYAASSNRVYLADKDMSFVAYILPLSVVEFQTAISRNQLDVAESILPKIPYDHLTRVAHFLESQGYKDKALLVTTDEEHKFDIALATDKLDIAYEIAQKTNSTSKWKLLGESALKSWNVSFLCYNR